MQWKEYYDYEPYRIQEELLATTRAQRKQNVSKTQASFAEQSGDKNQATCS